jgi:hypothetical protein
MVRWDRPTDRLLTIGINTLSRIFEMVNAWMVGCDWFDRSIARVVPLFEGVKEYYYYYY